MAVIRSADGTSIGYEIEGDGPVVVLVDGAMCFRGSGPQRAIASALRDRFRVVLYDRRGRGESGDSDSTARVQHEIEDLDAVIAAAGGRAALFGMSSGGALALAAAAALGGEVVPRVAVYEPPYLPDAMLGSAKAYSRDLAAALSAGDREAAIALFLRRVGVPEAGIEGMRRSPGWPDTVSLAPSLAYDDAAMGDSRVPDDILAALPAPILGLAGGASPEFLRFGAEEVAAAAQDGTFELVEGQTHDLNPAALAPHLVRFLGA